MDLRGKNVIWYENNNILWEGHEVACQKTRTYRAAATCTDRVNLKRFIFITQMEEMNHKRQNY